MSSVGFINGDDARKFIEKLVKKYTFFEKNISPEVPC